MDKLCPNVWIIILNWGGKEDTLECIESVLKLDYANYKVLIVDNNSTDGSVEAFKAKYPEIDLIENAKNLGYAGGNNVGIRYAMEKGADYFFLLNNDLIIDSKCLSEMIKVTEVRKDGGILGVKSLHYYEPNKIEIVGGKFSFITGKCYSVGNGEIDKGQYDKIQEFDFINGHAFLIRKEVIDKIGLLDEEYFAYNEETDWCYRASKAGYKCLYVPYAKVWHKGSRASSSILRSYLIYRNQILFMRKHASKVQLFIFYLHFFLIQVPQNGVSFFRSFLSHVLILIKAIGWNFGLWKKNNPLNKMLDSSR